MLAIFDQISRTTTRGFPIALLLHTLCIYPKILQKKSLLKLKFLYSRIFVVVKDVPPTIPFPKYYFRHTIISGYIPYIVLSRNLAVYHHFLGHDLHTYGLGSRTKNSHTSTMQRV